MFAACVDTPVCFAPFGESTHAQHLSELGLFSDLGNLTPAPGVVPYEVAVPLYSDGSTKHRMMQLPAGAQLGYGDDRWSIPPGTRFVKTFFFPRDARDPSTGELRIETRVLEATTDGFREGTYRWNATQNDALCSGGNEDVPVSVIDAAGAPLELTFHVPGTSRCQTCHESGSISHALGLRTRQMNVDENGVNQIDRLVDAGVLDRAPPPDQRARLPDPLGGAPLTDRAQSYLDVNCGNCHFSDGYAGGTGVFFDLGHAIDTRCRKTASVGGRAHVLVPGHPEGSEFLARMSSNDPFVRMPQGPNHRPDQPAIDLLSTWVSEMPAETCSR